MIYKLVIILGDDNAVFSQQLRIRTLECDDVHETFRFFPDAVHQPKELMDRFIKIGLNAK